MAMDRTRTRARASRRGANGRRTRRTTMREGVDTSIVPRVLVGAVNGVEIVAVGALRITRDVLVRTVAGAADIGAEALGATTAGVRGVVSATTRMLGDIAGAARGGFRETLNTATHARRGAAHVTRGAPSPSVTEDRSAAASRSTLTRRPRRRTRGPRSATRPGRPSLAA
jgi:hypothetical protein